MLSIGCKKAVEEGRIDASLDSSVSFRTQSMCKKNHKKYEKERGNDSYALIKLRFLA